MAEGRESTEDCKMESHERTVTEAAQDADRLNMESQKDRLIELIESEFGLLDKLLSSGALTKVKIAEVRSGTTLYKKNEFLLNYIFSGDKYQDLMKALSDCGQHHVVNWVKGNGEYKEEFGLDWPLRETEDTILDCNQEALVDLLYVAEILSKLYAMGVFNKRQKESIGSKPTEHERSEALLDAVRRFSLKSYFTFKECLRQSGQSHVADILENGGFIVPVHATLECENLDEVESRIVNQLTVEQADRLIVALQLKVIAVRRGKSIVSYISCNKEEEFLHLRKIIDNLEMRNILEQLSNQLIPNLKIKVLLVNVISKDIQKAQKIFRDMKNSWISKIRIGDLPLELIDVILQKCLIKSILRQSQSLNNQKDEDAVEKFASVDFCWFQRITNRRFKNVVWSKMKKYYEDKCKLYLMYKNNQQFFDEIHPISGKTRTTLSTDHFSNSETADGKRKRSLKKRQINIQMPRTAFLAQKNEYSDFLVPENKCSVFEDFLSSDYSEERKFIGEIMNTGGGAARVEIKASRPLSKPEVIPLEFEAKEMQILRLLADRDAVVWIWCLSHNALQKLNNRDGMKKLIEIFNQSVNATSDVLEHRTNIDYDLKKKIVSIPLIFADFRTALNYTRENLRENRFSEVIGVTKLKMKIYVLCKIDSWDDAGYLSDSTMICVFEDRSPYPIVEEILLRKFDINDCRSIVSSVKESCLYVLTSSKKQNHYVSEVIRVEIKETEENSPKHYSKLELEVGYHPYALSTSRHGDLIMINNSLPIILRIYDSDARLRLCVKVHKDIRKTFKAVETSAGNFIILHEMKRQTEDVDDGILAKELNSYSVLYKREKDDEIKKSSSFGSDPSDYDVVRTVSELSRDGKTIIRRFLPQNRQQQLDIPCPYGGSVFYGCDLCSDSRDRVFVTDPANERVIVLDSNLRWVGSLILQDYNGNENEKLLHPSKLLYDEDSHGMIIIDANRVFIYDLICQ